MSLINSAGIFLQGAAFTTIGDIFYQWESLGVFDFVLPFLLVFAIIFGILSTTGIMGGNKSVSVIIAFVIGLMSLRYQGFLSSFLSELFPRLGIGIAVLLTLLIMVGLFIADDERKYWGYGLGAIGFIIAIVVLSQTGDSLGWSWWGGSGSDNIGFIVLAVLIIGIIIAIATSGGGGGGERGSRSSRGSKSEYTVFRAQ